MAWHAKPYGGYTFSSAEGTENVMAINGMLNQRGYTLEAQGGMIGNIMGESSLNPWRWQSDTVNYSGGYGLFQYTPARAYINYATAVEGYAPNLSTSSQTSGADPADGGAQIIVFDENILGKWLGSCWRSYWDTSTYADLYQLSRDILNTYGDGNYLSMEQFRNINNLYDATFAFLACFEGPAIPNMTVRYAYAQTAYAMISGDTPPPGPTPTIKRKMPIWMYLKYF